MTGSRTLIFYRCTGPGAIIKWNAYFMVALRAPIFYRCTCTGAVIKWPWPICYLVGSISWHVCFTLGLGQKRLSAITTSRPKLRSHSRFCTNRSSPMPSSSDSYDSPSSSEEWSENEGDTTDCEVEIPASAPVRGKCALVIAKCPQRYLRDSAVRDSKKARLPTDIDRAWATSRCISTLHNYNGRCICTTPETHSINPDQNHGCMNTLMSKTWGCVRNTFIKKQISPSDISGSCPQSLRQLRLRGKRAN